MFKCSVCLEKSYTSQKALNKHDRQVHKVFKETRYECIYDCDETFTSKRKLLKHHSSHQENLREFNCRLCSKYYSSKSSLNKHIKNKHKCISQEVSKMEKSYECYQCGSIFSKKAAIISHINGHKNCYNRRLLCPVQECNEFFTRYSVLHNHLSCIHNVNIKQESYKFNSETEFKTWKSKIEHSLKASYVMDTSKKCLKNGEFRTYYECHRSLAPRLRGNPQRSSKSIGTNKINRACPSTLIVTCTSEQNITAVFYPIHIGHDNELGRLRIDEEERHKIAGKLSQGVTVDRILSDVRENVPNGQVHRIHLLEKKDINNIIRDYSIGYSTKRHKNDAVSVKLWVEAMKKLEKNPILYYKEQGEADDMFDGSDFILIIMTEFQANSFISFGKDKICIDGTHGLNQYGFQLYTLVVVDEFGSGIPVAFCFSNRGDVLLFEKFFQCIKEKVGIISTNVFMSDDYPAFYNAWELIMGGVSNRLLCTWHVNRNWVQNSKKICHKEKRSLVLKSLRILQKELSEELFLKQLESFLDQLKSDSDTFEFFQYFSRTYVDRSPMWAYCYRKYTGINTNMYLESLHKTIKHFYLQGRKCKRLDKTINALMNLVRDKMFEKIIKIEKSKATEKLIKIRSSHKCGESIPKEYIQNFSENQWYVLSSTNSNHNYVVEKLAPVCANFCELKCQRCQICVHSFKCSCPDNVINYNICKHIHACCLQNLSNYSFTPTAGCSKSSCDIQENLTSPPTCSSNKDFLNSKLEVILGLNNKSCVSDTDMSLISKYLDKVINIYNSNGQVNFEIKEKHINVAKKIEPQARTFTAKAKKRPSENINPLPFESKAIKLALSDSNSEVVNIQTGFDHTYSKI